MTSRTLWIFFLASIFHYGLSQSFFDGKNAHISKTKWTEVDIKKARSELLYPHDDYHLLDKLNKANSIQDTSLPFRIPFFGFVFPYVWIHRDGYLLFNKGLVDYPSPVRFPISNIEDPTREEDPSLIAPWFSHQDIPGEVEDAGVYAQIVNLANEKDDILKERLKLDFQDAMVGSQNFVPAYALIVTWRNLTFANRMPGSTLKTNSYQVVLATDEMRTYAMFNYDAINWVSDKDIFDGQKGDEAFIGFNAGNQTRAFEFLPYSQSRALSRLPSLGYGNGLGGRFYFQIDEEILPGSCIDRYRDINWSTRPKLTVIPRYGSMLGGTVVNVTGPCFEPFGKIRCKFDSHETNGIYVSPNHASCISPPIMYHGDVDLSVSIDDGPFLFGGKYYVQPPEIGEADVNILDGRENEEAPDRFTIQWSPEKLTLDTAASITVSLWGYGERNDDYPGLTYIDVLVKRTPNMNGVYSFNLNELRYRYYPGDLDFSFGFIAINLTETIYDSFMERPTSPVLWSAPLPLGWYFGQQWRRQLGNNWKEKLCDKWYTKEKHSDRFANTLFRCPCTVTQAKLDTGRFLPDLQCNEIDRKCATFHKSAYHCVRSGRPSASGAGQLCCYDDRGELIRTGDSIHGGRPARASQFGKFPYKKRMMIPTLSHWLNDVSPYFFCCKWAEGEENSETCEKYKYWRTSQDCSLYQPPAVASAFGDPHFLTFDLVNYTFNGKGEFVLSRVNDRTHKLDIQGRFEQPPLQKDSSTPVKGTRLMAVAARDNFSSIVEFRARPSLAQWQYQMFLLVDNEYVYFSDDSLRVMNFKGVTLYQPIGIYNMSHIVAMFDSGAGVEVRMEKGHMGVHVYLPPTLKNKTRGLLGNWSGIKEDDFVDPNGEIFVRPWSSTRDIHYRFGMKYRVTEGESYQVGKTLFFHDSLPFSHYDDMVFVPEFETPPPVPKNFSYDPQICGGSGACLFDLLVTGDTNQASATRNHDDHARHLASDVRLKQVRCPEIAKPKHSRKSEIRYYVGTRISYSCNDGYILVGNDTKLCRDGGVWSQGADPKCISEREYKMKLIAKWLEILLPVLVLGIMLCVLLVLMAKHKEIKKKSEVKGIPKKILS